MRLSYSLCYHADDFSKKTDPLRERICEYTSCTTEWIGDLKKSYLN